MLERDFECWSAIPSVGARFRVLKCDFECWRGRFRMLKCNFECRSAISSIEVRFRMLRGDFECCSVISGVQVRFRMLKCDSERRTTARACFGDRSSEHYKVSYSLTCESSSACASRFAHSCDAFQISPIFCPTRGITKN